jgi:hypothetical protein
MADHDILSSRNNKNGENMPTVNKRIQLQCVLDNLDDAQVEIVQLKMVIGLIIAKLPPEQREDLIQELRNFGLSSSAQEFTQFVVE